MRGISRRKFIGMSASAAGAAALGTLPHTLSRALAMPAAGRSLSAVRHVVVLMQENRSFDHYFGTLAGVRGFDDAAALTLGNGDSVFEQPGADGRHTPFHLDSIGGAAPCVPRSRPQLGRHASRMERRTLRSMDRCEKRVDDGLLHARRHSVSLRARRCVHDLRSLFLFGDGTDESESPVPLERHDQSRRRRWWTRYRQQSDRISLDDVSGTTRSGRRRLEGVSERRRQLRRQRARVVRAFPARHAGFAAVRTRHGVGAGEHGLER